MAEVIDYGIGEFDIRAHELGLDTKAEPLVSAELWAPRYDRLRQPLGALGILAFAHPNIKTREQAVGTRMEYEAQEGSTARHLAHLAGETLTAYSKGIKKWIGRMATRAAESEYMPRHAANDEFSGLQGA